MKHNMKISTEKLLKSKSKQNKQQPLPVGLGLGLLLALFTSILAVNCTDVVDLLPVSPPGGGPGGGPPGGLIQRCLWALRSWALSRQGEPYLRCS